MNEEINIDSCSVVAVMRGGGCSHGDLHLCLCTLCGFLWFSVWI